MKEHFVSVLDSLWAVMDAGGYAPHLNASLKRFNGTLFKTRHALPLDQDEITELYIAASKDWSDVEPAIFGTLLERALDPAERSKLGAHYTPRAYVERLVIPTIIDPLRADWEEVKAFAEDGRLDGKPEDAVSAIKSFHHTLLYDPRSGPCLRRW